MPFNPSILALSSQRQGLVHGDVSAKIEFFSGLWQLKFSILPKEEEKNGWEKSRILSSRLSTAKDRRMGLKKDRKMIGKDRKRLGKIWVSWRTTVGICFY